MMRKQLPTLNCRRDFIQGALYGVGIHVNTVTASLLAILSAMNRIDQQTQEQFYNALGKRA